MIACTGLAGAPAFAEPSPKTGASVIGLGLLGSALTAAGVYTRKKTKI